MKMLQSPCKIKYLQGKSMVHIKDRFTRQLFDPWRHLGTKRRKLLNESWAGLFREKLLPDLPVERIMPFFSSSQGRPTKELYAMLGTILFQQVFDLTDEETVSQMAFNLQWHYALDLPEESDDLKYLSAKTLWSMRTMVTDNNLDTVLFEKITDTLAKIFDVDTTQQRMDSVHIKSNMRRLGRIGILVRCLRKFLVNLKRQYKELFEALPQELVEKYFSDKAMACFSLVKPSEAERTLASISQDIFWIVQHFTGHRQVQAMYSYSLLTRVLQEQCRVKETTDGELVEIEVKPPKEVPSDSLQNPSDPDAGYSGHKGQGYQVQILETYSREAPEEGSAPKLELITHVQVEPAHKSDAHALIPALEVVAERNLAPKEVLADSLYGSDENCEAAEALGVAVVSPVKGSPADKVLLLAEFEFAPSGKVVQCPEGQEPVKVKCRGDRYTAAFEIEGCQNCPRRDECPILPGKRHFYLRYDRKAVRLAERRAREQTPEFRDRYRYRAGIEGTISAYEARTGVKQLRVRGLDAVRFCATLKATGVNILRAAVVRKAVLQGAEALVPETSGLRGAILFFKERCGAFWAQLKRFMPQLPSKEIFEPVFAR
jgi:hypothetical protein